MEIVVVIYVVGYLMAMGCHAAYGDFRPGGKFSWRSFAVIAVLGFGMWPVTLGKAIVRMGKRTDDEYKDEPWPLDD